MAKKYEHVAVAGKFCDKRLMAVAALEDQLPESVKEMDRKEVCHGDLCCLTLRKKWGGSDCNLGMYLFVGVGINRLQLKQRTKIP